MDTTQIPMEKSVIITVLETFYLEELQEICRSYDLEPIGNKMELKELIVRNVEPPSRIIKNFTEGELEMICSWSGHRYQGTNAE